MVPKKLIGWTAAALLALLATGFFSDRSTRVMDAALQSVDHSRDVLIAEAECRVFLFRAESMGRAYALTGGGGFAAGSDHAVGSLRQRLKELKVLTADNPEQQRALAGVSRLVDRRVELIRQAAAQKGHGASLQVLQATILQGAQVNARLDRALDGVHAEELRLLELRKRRAADARLFAVYGPWFMLAIAVLLTTTLLTHVYFALQGEQAARRQSEDAARLETAARLRAEESDRLKDDFLAAVSHELRTPLTAIVGWSGLLTWSKETREELLDAAVANIADAARTQCRLVEDLLDVSRISTGRMKLEIDAIDLPRLIEQAVVSISPSAEAKEITIHVSSDGNVDGIAGDGDRLQQVVWNVLANAVKFTPRRGRIDVALRRTNAHVEIVVTDTGEGITPEFLPCVFDRFRQAESGPTRRASGLGLGLSLVKQLVELHGGSVRVTSPGLGMGSTFTIELPILGKTRPAAGAPAVWSDDGAVRGKRIVVVEDDENTLKMLETMLARAGASVRTATRTADAMTLLATEPFDVMVCDIGLPAEDGISFVRRLRTMLTPYSRIPVIALTAYARTEDRVNVMSAGFNSYLAKPVTRDELLFALSTILGTGSRLPVSGREPSSESQRDQHDDRRGGKPHASPERVG